MKIKKKKKKKKKKKYYIYSLYNKNYSFYLIFKIETIIDYTNNRIH